MIDERILLGEPIPFGKICKIYPPTVRDVVVNQQFSIFRKLFTITQEELEELAPEGEGKLTPLELLLNYAYNSEPLFLIIQEGFEFFTHENVEFLFNEKAIRFAGGGVLDEKNYFDFQNRVRLALGAEMAQPPEPSNPNEDPRITRMKKMARERDRIKEKQAAKNGLTLSESLVSICCMGIGITPLNIGEMSYASVGALMNKYQLKEKYDLDTRSLLAGADPKKIKPKYWIREKE